MGWLRGGRGKEKGIAGWVEACVPKKEKKKKIKNQNIVKMGPTAREPRLLGAGASQWPTEAGSSPGAVPGSLDAKPGACVLKI